MAEGQTGSGATPAFVSKSEFARLRDVSAPMVTKWGKQGRLVLTPEGKVDVARSMALIDAQRDPAPGGKDGKSSAAPTAGQEKIDTGPAPGTFDSVRAVREQWVAKSAEIAYRREVGQLIERDAFVKAIADAMAPLMASLDSISSRIGPKVAAETDVRKVQNIIDAEIEDIRTDMANTLGAMVAGAGPTRQ